VIKIKEKITEKDLIKGNAFVINSEYDQKEHIWHVITDVNETEISDICMNTGHRIQGINTNNKSSYLWILERWDAEKSTIELFYEDLKYLLHEGLQLKDFKP
jgi:hypothetical protein